MNLDRLRSQIPQDQDDEKLLQEIVDSKFKVNTLHSRVFRSDVPDIKTPEEEAEWQKVIDEREAKIRKQAFGETVVLEQDIKKMEEEKEKLEAEIEAEIAPEAQKVSSEEIKPEEATETATEATETDSAVKCELCGSRGYRHKLGCPTLS